MASTIDPRRAWERYTPDTANPWDQKKVGHLYRRAAFGATWTELHEGVNLGPDALIDRLLKGGVPSTYQVAVSPDDARLLAYIAAGGGSLYLTVAPPAPATLAPTPAA